MTTAEQIPADVAQCLQDLRPHLEPRLLAGEDFETALRAAWAEWSQLVSQKLNDGQFRAAVLDRVWLHANCARVVHRFTR